MFDGTRSMTTIERMLKLFLPYPVSLNRLYRVFRGKIVPSAEATRWGKQVRFIASQKPVEVTKDNIRMEVAIHPKLTISGLPSKVLIDIDAPLKKLFDSLEGLVYENDKQIKKLYVYYAEPIINGGLTVNIDKDE